MLASAGVEGQIGSSSGAMGKALAHVSGPMHLKPAGMDEMLEPTLGPSHLIDALPPNAAFDPPQLAPKGAASFVHLGVSPIWRPWRHAPRSRSGSVCQGGGGCCFAPESSALGLVAPFQSFCRNRNPSPAHRYDTTRYCTPSSVLSHPPIRPSSVACSKGPDSIH